MVAIAIHGGAGAVPRNLLTSGKEKAYRAGLESALDSAYAILERGGSSLDAVRVGDSPIIGAGTYAKNGVCAVSATGQGEYFIRAVAAYHICSAVEYRGLTLEAAAREMLHGILQGLGGSGGIIAVSGGGQVVMDFSTEGMFRGARDSEGLREVAIY